MTYFNNIITLQWIPGHIGIEGNEKADKLSKAGSTMEQLERPVNYNTINAMLKNDFKEEWLNQWATGSTGRAMYKDMNTPNKRDNINFLPRREQTIIFQLRTGHTALNFHLNKLNPTHLPHCRHCSYPYETVEHVLFECTQLSHLRKTLLPQLPNITNTLYGSMEQMKKTSQFFSLALTAQELTAQQHKAG